MQWKSCVRLFEPGKEETWYLYERDTVIKRQARNIFATIQQRKIERFKHQFSSHLPTAGHSSHEANVVIAQRCRNVLTQQPKLWNWKVKRGGGSKGVLTSNKQFCWSILPALIWFVLLDIYHKPTLECQKCFTQNVRERFGAAKHASSNGSGVWGQSTPHYIKQLVYTVWTALHYAPLSLIPGALINPSWSWHNETKASLG